MSYVHLILHHEKNYWRTGITLMLILLLYFVIAAGGAQLTTLRIQAQAEISDLQSLILRWSQSASGNVAQIGFKFVEPIVDKHSGLRTGLSEVGSNYVCFLDWTEGGSVERCTPFTNIVTAVLANDLD